MTDTVCLMQSPYRFTSGRSIRAYLGLCCGFALFSFYDSKDFWHHCFEPRALEVIVPAKRSAEGPSQIAG